MNTSVRGAIGKAAELVGLERAARDQPSRRIEPQRLLQHLVGEGERLGGVEPERPIAAGAIGLGLAAAPRRRGAG